MYFDSLAALVAMEGHGPYVWSAYAITTLVLVGLVIAPLRRRRQIMNRLRMQLRREQASSSSHLSNLGDSHASGS